MGSVEAIATHFASGRSMLGAVNKPTQLDSVVPSSTTARPVERRLISLAPADLAERLFGLEVPGPPFRWKKADHLTFVAAGSIG